MPDRRGQTYLTKMAPSRNENRLNGMMGSLSGEYAGETGTDEGENHQRAENDDGDDNGRIDEGKAPHSGVNFHGACLDGLHQAAPPDERPTPPAGATSFVMTVSVPAAANEPMNSSRVAPLVGR